MSGNRYEVTTWALLAILGYVALFALVPQDQGRGWVLGAFTALVVASGAWLVTELRKNES